MAVIVAMDPDYPVARGEGTSLPSASRGPVLLPVPTAPRGDCDLSRLAFAWEWVGPPTAWELVILDAELQSVFTTVCSQGSEMAAPEQLRRLLVAGQVYYWLVRNPADAGVVRTSPVLFRPTS